MENMNIVLLYKGSVFGDFIRFYFYLVCCLCLISFCTHIWFQFPTKPLVNTLTITEIIQMPVFLNDLPFLKLESFDLCTT